MKLPSCAQDKIIIALDVPNTDSALRLLDCIAGEGELPRLCKIGLELFTAEGPSVVKAIQSRDCAVFLDLKFHDIPNTVAHAVRSAADLGIAMTTLHASGGPVMLEAAAKSAEQSGNPNLLLLAVTVLTSIDASQLSATGIITEPEAQVLRLAGLATQAGIGGIVCSPQEIRAVRTNYGNQLRLVTPGVRPLWAAAGDQKRIMTPSEAIGAGADWLVIGRPITAAENSSEAYQRVLAEIS